MRQKIKSTNRRCKSNYIIITLKVSGLNNPYDRMSDYIFKKWLANYMLSPIGIPLSQR